MDKGKVRARGKEKAKAKARVRVKVKVRVRVMDLRQTRAQAGRATGMALAERMVLAGARLAPVSSPDCRSVTVPPSSNRNLKNIPRNMGLSWNNT